MKRFKFKLQTLLDIREAKEKEIQNELAKVLSLQNMERDKQERLRNSIEVESRNFRDKFLKGTYSVSEAIMYEKYIDISLRAIDIAGERIKDMEPAIQKVRERLIEASKEKKVVEKLKERRLREYNYEVNKEIVKENDDTNQKIYIRNMMELT